MNIVVDLNILRGDKFVKDNNNDYVIPLLLILELMNSDSINDDGKINLLQKIIDRNYKIDIRHPRTIFCDFVGIINEDQKIYNLFLDDLITYKDIKIERVNEMINWNKNESQKNDISFIEHDYSKVIDKDLYKYYLKEYPQIKEELDLAIINEIKKSLIESYFKNYNISLEKKKFLPQSLEVYFSVMAYYQYKATKGPLKHNDFTDINYMLYLDKGRKFYSKDNTINNALKNMKPELIYSIN